ncbi:MAG: respiratory nitrate reductase subunit gamma [Thermodesulfobacteriota bacterium]
METWNIIVFLILPHLAAAGLVVGLAYRIRVWLRTPVPLKIPLTPTPETRLGAARRLARQALGLPNLRRRSPLLWLATMSFHLALLLVLLRHLRYFLDPVPEWVLFLQKPGVAAGYVLPAALLLLLSRRLVSRPLLHVSRPADYFILALLLGVSLSGLALRLLFRTDLLEVKAWSLGLVSFSPFLPGEPGLFTLHLSVVLVLAAYFPFSKLTHGLGLFFSPALSQPDDALWTRHVNPWDGEEEE